MGAALPTILNPGVVNDTISELIVKNDRLQSFFAAGGSAQRSGRHFGWDVFNATREVESLRMPGTPPSRIRPQVVGSVSGRFPRAHSSIPLLFEDVHNNRQLGSLQVDAGGKNYIVRQEGYLKQRYANLKELMWMAVFRGALYYTQVGDDLTLSLTSGDHSLNWLTQAGNFNQLNMLGGGAIIDASWNTASTNIPGHVEAISAAMEVLTGDQVTDLFCNSVRWQKILNNDIIKGQAGTANIVFERFERIGHSDAIAVLKNLPMYTWHIQNGGININGTFTPMWTDNQVGFSCRPSAQWVQWMEGSEIVVESPGATPVERFGEYYWAESTTKPAGYELTGLVNAVPVLYVPNNLGMATVHGF